MGKTRAFYQLNILLTLFILLISCETPQRISVWDVLDTGTVFILESNHPPEEVDTLYSTGFLAKKTQYLSSLQRSSKGDFDILYSHLLAENDYDSLLINLDGQKIIKRIFNGTQISEVRNRTNEIQVSFAYLDGILVLSKSPFLVENAIRVFKNIDERGFKKNNEALFQFPSLQSDVGNIYINFKNLSEVSAIESPMFKEIPLLNELRELSVYDVKSESDFLALRGFSIGENSSLGDFQKQKPVILNVARYVPNYSTALVHFGISDFDSFNGVLDSTFIKTFKPGSEIAFVTTDNILETLSAFVELRSSSLQDFSFITDYSETYSNYQIKSVNGDMLKKGFGRIFPSVLFRFCVIKDNCLILSQSIDEMKSLIDAIESDNTWGKTADYQKFINRGLQESNVTMVFKKPKLLSENFLKDYSGIVASLGLTKVNWFSIQMSALDNHFYSTVNLSLESSDLKMPKIERNSITSFIELSGSVRFASLVKNHNTGLQEMLIQDSDLTIYLVSLAEGVIWKRPLDGQIQNRLQQIDFYKNGKLQYYFIVKNKLYIIDRLGRDINGFPKALDSSPQFSTLVDYDKNRNYRFLISYFNNEISLLDKEGSNINEWGPKKFEKSISSSPQHIKIGGKDFFVVVLSDGSVQLINRKGEQKNLFYLKEKKSLDGEFYLASGMSPETSYLYYLSADEAIVKQNLKGDILSIQNLLRGKNSVFKLKRNVNEDDFNFYRIDTDKIAVFNKTGKLLFERQNSGSTNLEFQCFNSDDNKQIFSFYDVEQKLIRVFDETGNDLFQTPIESEIMPIFGFGKSKNEFGIFSFPQNAVVFNTIR